MTEARFIIDRQGEAVENPDFALATLSLREGAERGQQIEGLETAKLALRGARQAARKDRQLSLLRQMRESGLIEGETEELEIIVQEFQAAGAETEEPAATGKPVAKRASRSKGDKKEEPQTGRTSRGDSQNKAVEALRRLEGRRGSSRR